MSASVPLPNGLTAFLDLVRDTILSDFSDVYYTKVTNYVAFIGYTLLVWDHIITFGDEVRFVWFSKKTPLAYLFFINRYVTPLAFIGNLTAYFSHWTPERCQSFVRYEGACTTIALEVTALMMLVRISALYAHAKKVIYLVAFLLALETAVLAWLMTHGMAVGHGPSVYACTMIYDPRLHFWPSFSAWLPLIFDTVVISLTLWRCMPPVKQRTASHIMRTLVRDGLLYYGVIFGINFVLAIMIVTAKDGIKNIMGQIEQLLTVAMMSRITLSLKREGLKERGVDPDSPYFDTDPAAPEPLTPVNGRFGGTGWRSGTRVQHISVIPISNRTSLLSGGRSIVSPNRPAGTYFGRPPKRHSRVVTGTQGSIALGVDSIDSMYSQSSGDGQRRDANIPAIAEHERLSERDAYELRSLRPSTTTGSFTRY